MRFYLHFCNKYGHQPGDPGSLPLFIAKLASKGQTVPQQAEAQRAIGYYRALLSPSSEPMAKARSETMAPDAADENAVAPIPEVIPTVTKDVLPPAQKKPDPIQDPWQEVADKLKEQIMLAITHPRLCWRSLPSGKAYSVWMWKLCRFLNHQSPSEVTSRDAQRFLADLAVREQVSASAPNQAFNALLFLFRHVLERELGDLSDTHSAFALRSYCTHRTVAATLSVDGIARLAAAYGYVATASISSTLFLTLLLDGFQVLLVELAKIKVYQHSLDELELAGRLELKECRNARLHAVIQHHL